MQSFSKFDHIIGAINVRVHRFVQLLLNRPDVSIVTSNLFIGGVNEIKNLNKIKINAVLDLRKENHDDYDELKNYSIDYLRVGIPDRDVPSIEQTKTVLQWIDSNLGKKRRLFIHCNLGRGRAPLIACIYFIEHGMNKLEAIQLIKNIRSYTYFNSKQLEWIKKYGDYIKSNKSKYN